MYSPSSHFLFEMKLFVCLSVCLQMWFYKSFTTNANLLWLWESPMLVRCNAEWVPFIQSEAIEAATVGWRASPRPVPCFLLVPYPNLPYPPLRQQLHSHAHPFFTPTLMLWNPQTLLGLLSIRGAMRSSVQRTSQSVSHPAHPVSLPPLHLHRSAPPADQPLLPVHPVTPPPPLPHPIACLANLQRQKEEKQETRVRLRLRRLRGRSLYLWIYPQLKS